MPKVKIPRKSTNIDMTAMCDVAFLLLTFFILTAQFRPEEPVIVDTPSSISKIKLPETDIMLLTVSNDGRVFFSMDGQPKRKQLLEELDTKKNLNLNENQMNQFAIMSSVGVPFEKLSGFLNLDSHARTKYKQEGIPTDTTDNQLKDWILYSRFVNPKVRIAIKADGDAPYTAVQRVIQTLQDQDVNKFNLITDMETDPRTKHEE